MKKAGLLLVLFYSLHLHAQTTALEFRSGHKVKHRYWVGSDFSFQTDNHNWMLGTLTKVQPDSFFIQPYRLQRSLFGIDTVHFPVIAFAIRDIRVINKPAYKIHEVNGHYEIQGSAGHAHFYWIKSGWLFRAGALGYTGLNLANNAIDGKLQWKGNHYAVAAAFFTAGVLMKKMYKVEIHIKGKKTIRMFGTTETH